MNKLQEKLNFLLDKYSVETKAELTDNRDVVIDGTKVPFLSALYERRFLELKNIVSGGTLVGISVMRIARTVAKGSDIYDELYREFGICQYVLGRKICSVAVMENGNVLDAIAKTEDGVVCTFEIAATLSQNDEPKDKHEIISQRGIACDVVVDAQLKQDSIYVFGEDNEKFTDVDFELYGLTIDEAAIVRGAFAAAKNKNTDELIDLDKNLCALVELAKKSAKSGEREAL